MDPEIIRKLTVVNGLLAMLPKNAKPETRLENDIYCAVTRKANELLKYGKSVLAKKPAAKSAFLVDLNREVPILVHYFKSVTDRLKHVEDKKAAQSSSAQNVSSSATLPAPGPQSQQPNFTDSSKTIPKLTLKNQHEHEPVEKIHTQAIDSRDSHGPPASSVPVPTPAPASPLHDDPRYNLE